MLSTKCSIILSAALLVSVTSGYMFADAKWHLPIHPGDHVFDAKRFNDSVKETAAMLNENMMNLKILKDRLIMYANEKSGINQKTNAAFTQYEDSLNGQSIISQDGAMTNNKILHTTMNDYDIYTDTGSAAYKMRLLNELESANQDAVTAQQRASANTASRTGIAADICGMHTSSVIGTRQKTASVAALSALNEAEDARAQAAALMEDIMQDEASYALEEMERQQMQKFSVYGYDPYHPTKYDQEHAPQTENFGFLSTQDTGE